MKQLMIVLLALGVAFGASAQRVHGTVSVGGGYHPGPRPRVIVGGGFYAPVYPFYGPYAYSPFWPYSPYYARPARPTHLDLQIADIRNDYQQRIWSARHDASLSRKERKATVRQLRHDREEAIIEAKRGYYKTPTKV